MNELRSQLRATGRIGIVVSSYHERITTKLLEGALACCRDAGVPDSAVDVVWVSGAFELGSVTAALAEQGRYTALVAIGVVIRGETPHFEFVAGETSRALGTVSTARALPVGFGLLTVDTMAQALERAGGSAGNKGYEAAEAAIRAADVIRQVRAS